MSVDRARMQADPGDVPAADALAGRLLRTMCALELPCCYWKLSRHLRRAILDPSKDLDLLVGTSRWADAIAVLEAHGYRRMSAPPGALPGAEHWVGFDERRGVLDHVHLHRELHAGRPPVYEWRLAWEDHLLAHLVRHPELDAMVLEPALELVLLGVRAVIEPKHRDGDIVREATRRELERLGRNVDPAQVRAHASELLGPEVATRLADRPRLDVPSEVAAFRGAVERALVRRVPRAAATALWASHVAASLARGAARRVWKVEPPRRGLRRAPHGFIVAVLGADGAGKTTLTQDLTTWLGEVLDVERLYLGRGDRISQAQQLVAEAKWLVLETFAGRRRPAVAKSVDDRGTGERARSTSLKERALRVVRDTSYVALARRKRRDLARARRLRRDGVLVITDRYPHPTIRELDGPGIVVESHDPLWRRALAALERRELGAFVSAAPDLVLRLRIDPAVAHSRKPDHRLDDIMVKVDALERATFGSAKVVDIDASAPLDEVRASARRAIWEVLCDAE